MTKVLVSLVAATLVALSFGTERHGNGVEASQPGFAPAPLLSCPDFGGDGTVDLYNDIFAVAFLFGATNGDANYHPLYDFALADGTIDLYNDIFAVALEFGAQCPPVDTEVARATVWGIENLPATENAAALAAIGYYRGSTDVPGQGVHYTKLENWDGVFDPMAPEGLVYNNGKLVAQLYVVSGDVVGWGSPPPNPSGPSMHNVNIDSFCSPQPPNTDRCSWATNEGWHDHHNLCTVHIGTPGSIALPGLSSSGCFSFSGGEPLCTVPVTTTPCYRWDDLVGWMGHLWNHQLNPNWIDEDGDTVPDNGRFADCSPDLEGWKASTCPS
jgi:hypothetical protein